MKCIFLNNYYFSHLAPIQIERHTTMELNDEEYNSLIDIIGWDDTYKKPHGDGKIFDIGMLCMFFESDKFFFHQRNIKSDYSDKVLYVINTQKHCKQYIPQKYQILLLRTVGV